MGKGYGDRKRTDIWWGGLKGKGGLMIILGYLLQSSRNWFDAEVRLKMVIEDKNAEEDAMKNLVRIVDKIRIGAKPEIIVSNGRPFNEILHNSSKDADLVFLGMAEPDKDFTSYYEGLQHSLSGLLTTIIVLAAEEISLGEVLMQQDNFQGELKSHHYLYYMLCSLVIINCNEIIIYLVFNHHL